MPKLGDSEFYEPGDEDRESREKPELGGEGAAARSDETSSGPEPGQLGGDSVAERPASGEVGQGASPTSSDGDTDQTVGEKGSAPSRGGAIQPASADSAKSASPPKRLLASAKRRKGNGSRRVMGKRPQANWVYDPTRLEMLRSQGREDVPPASPFQYHAGARHPSLQDLELYLQPVEPGALMLPATVPLLARPEGPPQNRVPYYGLSLAWQNPQRCTHWLVLGKTGSGKNTRVIDLARFSALKDRAQTVISVSLKSSDFGPIKITCDRFDKRCLVVNFDNDRRSHGFNPLQYADSNEAPDIIRRLADSSRNPRSGESEFWTQMLRTGMLALYEGGIRSFPEMFRFFSQSRSDVLDGLGNFDNPHARKLKDFFAGSSWNAETTEATIIGAFVPFQSESVQRVMSRDELRLERLFEEPVCLHIEVNEATLETSLPLVQMLLRSVVDKLIATAQRLGHKAIPATIFIDDLPSLGQVFSVERLLTLRSRQVGVVAGCQSIGALFHAFPNAGPAILEAFANQILLPGCGAEDADYFSRASGEQLVSVAVPGGQASQFLTLPLLSASDIRSPGYSHFLLGKPLTFLIGDLAFQAYLQHSYEFPEWREILRQAAEITGTEPLRSRRLPNRFKAAEKVGGRIARRHRKSGQKTLPCHFSRGDVKGWSDADFEKAIRLGLEHLNYSEAFTWIKEWWDRFVELNRNRSLAMLNLLCELMALESSASEYYYAFTHSDSKDPLANLAWIAFSKSKAAGERRKNPPKEAGRARRQVEDQEGVSDLVIPEQPADEYGDDEPEWVSREWELEPDELGEEDGDGGSDAAGLDGFLF